MYICSLWGNSIKHNSWATTTKIILIISSSTKILYLKDILLKCLPKKIKHQSSKHREM